MTRATDKRKGLFGSRELNSLIEKPATGWYGMLQAHILVHVQEAESKLRVR